MHTGPAVGTHPPSKWRCRPEPQHSPNWVEVLEHFWEASTARKGVTVAHSAPRGLSCPISLFLFLSGPILALIFLRPQSWPPLSPGSQFWPYGLSDPNLGPPDPQIPILDISNLILSPTPLPPAPSPSAQPTC